MAPFASGLRRLNTMYGKVLDCGQITKLGAFDAIRDGIDDGLIAVPLSMMSWVPACRSDSWVSAELTPNVSTTLSTYWCRSESVDCFQAGFLTRSRSLPGVYELIWYGPSAIVCWSSCRLFGT